MKISPKRISSPRKQALRFLEDRRGGAAIVMTLLAPVLIGGMAFGAELGFWELEKRKIQNAVDTAAHAAGTQLRSGLTDDYALKAIARNVAEVGGYEGGAAGITVVQPPASGAYSGNANALRVTLNHEVPRTFSKVFSQDPVAFTVSSTALVSAGRPACVLSTHRSASGAISAGGSTTVNLVGCDIAANSISPSSVSSTGAAADVNTECLSTVGGVSDPHGNYDLNCPAPITNGPLTADPYASVPEPTCTSYSAGNTFRNNVGGGAGTLFCWQGVGAINPSVTLTSGKTYVLHNSNVVLNGGRSITGTNVTLVLTGNSSIRLNGNSTLSLTAPTSGTYSGLAIMGSRTNAIDMNFSGNNGAFIVGAVYSPNSGSDIIYTGSSTVYGAGQCTQVIGGTVTFWGNSNFSTNCALSGTRAIMASQSIKIVE
jgi:Flp pilus assembly protein TadG